VHVRPIDLPEGGGSEGFPHDPDFPQLVIASDPASMLEVFRAHLKPISARAGHIEDCVPFRFRCRQSTSRCVLQYTLGLVEPGTGRRWDQWVTGLVYAREGEAERLWRELRAADPRRDIPEPWLSFEPVDYIPELRMAVQVFPFDRRLRHLSTVLGGAVRTLKLELLARLGPGRWRAGEATLERTRYRTELGAALRCSIRARQERTGRIETLRCYMKVYRNQRGADTFRLLRSCAERGRADRRTYSVIHPLGYLGELRTLVLEEAPGHSLQQLLLDDRDPAAAVRPAARAVAAFHRDNFDLGRRRSAADELEDVRRAAAAVQWACPEKATAIRAIADAVAADLRDVPPAPTHGDLKPDHIFLAGDQATFIDLDSAAMGDPVRDAAHLYSYIVGGVGLDAMHRERVRAAAAAFVDEYFDRVPRSWRERFPAHCAGALIEVAWGIFRHQEPRWAAKVAVAVEEARHALSGDAM